MITEPALTNNFGLLLPDDGFHDGLREMTRATGTLLAYDETHTQVVGPGGLTALWGLEPDFVTVGKSIAAGIPLGAYGMTEEVAAVPAAPEGPRRASADMVALGGTLFGNPLSMAAARATMGEVLTDDAYAHTQRLGARLADGMRASVETGRAAVAHRTGSGRAPAVVRPAPMPRTRPRRRACANDLLTRLIRIYLANRGRLGRHRRRRPVLLGPRHRRGRRRLSGRVGLAGGAAHELSGVS